MANIKALAEYTHEEASEFIEQFKALKPLDNPNEFGFKFDPYVIEKLGESIIHFPLEHMAEFCSGNFKKLCESGDEFVNGYVANIRDFIDDKYFQGINSATIGNLAYTALHSTDDQIKAKAKQCLEDFHTYYTAHILSKRRRWDFFLSTSAIILFISFAYACRENAIEFIWITGGMLFVNVFLLISIHKNTQNDTH